MLGGWEIAAIVFVALLLFGSTKLPKMARSMGQSVNEFKTGLSEGNTDKPALEEDTGDSRG